MTRNTSETLATATKCRVTSIADLSYLQELPKSDIKTDTDLLGGEALAYTYTYTAPGVATAGAIAAAASQVTKVITHTNVFVHDLRNITVSKAAAFALAISYTANNVDVAVSKSKSVTIFR